MGIPEHLRTHELLDLLGILLTLLDLVLRGIWVYQLDMSHDFPLILLLQLLVQLLHGDYHIFEIVNDPGLLVDTHSQLVLILKSFMVRNLES